MFQPNGVADPGSPVLEMIPMKKRYARYAVPAICLLLIAGYLLGKQEISVDTILSFTPQNPMKAAAVFLLLYAVKSATIFFPVIILEIAVGHLFSPLAAFTINTVGLLIILTIPYLMGKTAGIETIQKLVQKYPRFGELLGRQQENVLFLCFFLRIISCLPGDVVTMYLGATNTPFWKNLVAGTLGLLPGMILATFMGGNIQNPESPMFWISAALMGTLAGLSVLLYYAYKKRLHRKALIEEASVGKEMI